jgi:hypothetical protein
MLHPSRVAQKIADMIFNDKEYPNGIALDLPQLKNQSQNFEL